MATILEQNLLLWKVYQKHQAMLNNCTLESIDGNDGNNTTTTTNVTVDQNVSISSTLPPCDTNLLSDVASLIAALDFENFTSAAASTFSSSSINNGTNVTFQLDSNGGTVFDQTYENNRFFIERPHDMLHPSEINPSFMPIIITHTLTFLIGVIGNCVVIATWSMHGKFRSPTAVFLVSLAIADLFLLLVFVPLETLEYFMITWGGLSSICKSIAYVEVISAMSTVLNLVAVSIERFLVIVYPMRARSWCTMSSTRKGLIFIWGLAFLLSTPVLLTKHTSQITYYNSTTSLTLYYCFDVENDLTFVVALYQLLVMFLLPALFMVVCYYVVIRQLWVSTRSVNVMTQSDNQSRPLTNLSQFKLAHRSSSIHFRAREESTLITDYSLTSSLQDNERYNTTNDPIDPKRGGNIWNRWRGKKLDESTCPPHTDMPSLSSSTFNKMDSINESDKQRHHQQLADQYGRPNGVQCSSTLNRQESQDSSFSNRTRQSSKSNCQRYHHYCSCLCVCCLHSSSPVNMCDSSTNGKSVTGELDVSESTMSTYQMTSFVDSSGGGGGGNIVRPIRPINNMFDAKRTCPQQQQHPGNTGSIDLECRASSIDTDYCQQTETNSTVNNRQQSGEIFLIRKNSTHNTTTNSAQFPVQMTNGQQQQPNVQQLYSRTLANNVMEITKSRIQVIKMLVLIVALFLLCWGPRLIMNVLVKLGLQTYSTWIYNTRIVCNLLSFVHSALNPFVYGFMSSNFRAMVCSSFKRKKPMPKYLPNRIRWKKRPAKRAQVFQQQPQAHHHQHSHPLPTSSVRLNRTLY